MNKQYYDVPPTEWWCGSYLKQMESYLSAVGNPSSYDAEWCGSIIPGTAVLLLVHHCLHMYCMWLGFQLQLPRTSFFTLPLSHSCPELLKITENVWLLMSFLKYHHFWGQSLYSDHSWDINDWSDDENWADYTLKSDAIVQFCLREIKNDEPKTENNLSSINLMISSHDWSTGQKIVFKKLPIKISQSPKWRRPNQNMK